MNVYEMYCKEVALIEEFPKQALLRSNIHGKFKIETPTIRQEFGNIRPSTDCEQLDSLKPSGRCSFVTS